MCTTALDDIDDSLLVASLVDFIYLYVEGIIQLLVFDHMLTKNRVNLSTL